MNAPSHRPGRPGNARQRRGGGVARQYRGGGVARQYRGGGVARQRRVGAAASLLAATHPIDQLGATTDALLDRAHAHRWLLLHDASPPGGRTVRRMLARLAVILAGLATLLGLTAAPAWAHAGGLNPTDARSTVTGVTPRQPGVTATTVDNGTRVEVRVPGQPAARVAVPVVRVSADTTTRTWQLPVRTGAGTFVVRGRTDYVPGPSPWPWVGLMLALAVPGYLFARTRWWRAGLTACILAATAANLIHAVGSALAVSGQPFFWLFIGASGVGLVTWPLAVVAVVAAIMRRQFVAFAATLIGAMLVVAGFPDIDSLRRSQLPFAWPPDLDRLLVALTLGVGAGLAIGGIAALHRHLVIDSPPDPEAGQSQHQEPDPTPPAADEPTPPPPPAAREPRPSGDPATGSPAS